MVIFQGAFNGADLAVDNPIAEDENTVKVFFESPKRQGGANITSHQLLAVLEITNIAGACVAPFVYKIKVTTIPLISG